ncbi:MAG: TIGR00282 family metallophosphoesterase [Erysipelotrichales bacterium]|nr:TIGR00282 family metallophosphoesterase [Erysipelotrichales bacterium]
MKILMIGDIVGKNGRQVVNKLLPGIIKKHNIDFVIANGENATHGKGLIENHYNYLLNSGVDVVTLGNHYNSKDEIVSYINGADQLIRPCNLKNDFPGVGSAIYNVNDYLIRVTNVLGKAFMKEEIISPYDAIKNIIENEEKADIHIIDFHGEATGEKQSIAWAFDGLVSAVIGTHTHVQTRDARILPNGTGFMCDVGMCGPYNGVLGSKRENVISTLWLDDAKPFVVEDKDDSLFNAVILDINEENGKCENISPIYLIENHK